MKEQSCRTIPQTFCPAPAPGGTVQPAGTAAAAVKENNFNERPLTRFYSAACYDHQRRRTQGLGKWRRRMCEHKVANWGGFLIVPRSHPSPCLAIHKTTRSTTLCPFGASPMPFVSSSSSGGVDDSIPCAHSVSQCVQWCSSRKTMSFLFWSWINLPDFVSNMLTGWSYVCIFCHPVLNSYPSFLSF